MKSLLLSLDKETIIRLFHLSNEDILSKIVETDAVAAMSQLEASNAFVDIVEKDANIFSPLLLKVKSYDMLAILLRNGLNLAGLHIPDPTKIWIVKFLMNDNLKIKINPNAPVANSFNTPFWRNMLINRSIVDTGFLKELAKTDNMNRNLTEPLDVNAVDKDGDTYLHSKKVIFDEIIELNPDIKRKNNDGISVELRRKNPGWENAAYNKYIGNELEHKLASTQEELSKALARAQELQKIVDSIKSTIS